MTSVVLLVGAVLCSLATIAVSDDLVRTTSATNIPGVLLTTWLLAAIFQARK